MARLALFLDDGGVLNDDKVRSTQWQRLVGEYFAPRLGGSKEAWATANRTLINNFLAPDAWKARLNAADSYASFRRTYFLDWLGGMCGMVGIEPPPAERAIEMSQEATFWVIPQVRSAYSGAIDTVRLLHSRGYALYTASGSPSDDLEGYLTGMGILDCFTRLYGPDLVDTFKNGPDFYRRLFADAEVAPSGALVLDDNSNSLDWAAQAGAGTLLVGSPLREREISGHATIPSLADLPAYLERLNHASAG